MTELIPTLTKTYQEMT